MGDYRVVFHSGEEDVATIEKHNAAALAEKFNKNSHEVTAVGDLIVHPTTIKYLVPLQVQGATHVVTCHDTQVFETAAKSYDAAKTLETINNPNTMFVAVGDALFHTTSVARVAKVKK